MLHAITCYMQLTGFTGFTGFTALHTAACDGSVNTVEWLLEMGAKNTPDKYGLTPLLVAAKRGKADVVELYLDK